MAGSKIAPALIAGDVVAFKPPTQGSISGLLLVEAFVEAGIPAGVLNSITGRGSVIGDYIVEHKAVDFINLQVRLQSVKISVVWQQCVQ